MLRLYNSYQAVSDNPEPVSMNMHSMVVIWISYHEKLNYL